MMTGVFLSVYSISKSGKELSERDRSEKSRRALYLIHKTIPNLEKLIKKLGEAEDIDGIDRYCEEVKGFDCNYIKDKEWLEDFKKSENTYDASSKVLNLLATIPQFINSGLVDEREVYSHEAPYFKDVMKRMRPYLAAHRVPEDGNYYHELVDLYKKWEPRFYNDPSMKITTGARGYRFKNLKTVSDPYKVPFNVEPSSIWYIHPKYELKDPFYIQGHTICSGYTYRGRNSALRFFYIYSVLFSVLVSFYSSVLAFFIVLLILLHILFFPPVGPYIQAEVAHDWLITSRKGAVDESLWAQLVENKSFYARRKLIDNNFYKMMNESKINPFRRNLMYIVARINSLISLFVVNFKKLSDFVVAKINVSYRK